MGGGVRGREGGVRGREVNLVRERALTTGLSAEVLVLLCYYN